MSPPEPALTWAPDRRAVGVCWGLAAVCALVAALTGDPKATLLLGIAAVVLGVLALFGTRARPRLAADGTGVTVRGLTGARRWPWREVNVRLVRTRRFGRESTAVELDADNAPEPALVVLGRLDLGADPQDVVEALLRLRT